MRARFIGVSIVQVYTANSARHLYDGIRIRVHHSNRAAAGSRICRRDGVNAGVEGVLRYYPDTGTVVAILANQDCDVWDMANDVHDALKELSIS